MYTKIKLQTRLQGKLLLGISWNLVCSQIELRRGAFWWLEINRVKDYRDVRPNPCNLGKKCTIDFCVIEDHEFLAASIRQTTWRNWLKIVVIMDYPSQRALPKEKGQAQSSVSYKIKCSYIQKMHNRDTLIEQSCTLIVHSAEILYRRVSAHTS